MLNIKGDLKNITRHLNRVQKKQIPFAASLAINNTLKQVVKAEKAQIVKKLDRPTPFTVNAFKINWSKKHRLHGEVVIKPAQWKYLKYQIEGGTRTKNPIVPTKDSKLNQYGNIMGIWSGAGSNKTLTKAKNKFANKAGVWHKTGGKRNPKIKLIAAFVRSATYKKRFPFYKIADGVARSQFKKNLRQSLHRALTTAR